VLLTAQLRAAGVREVWCAPAAVRLLRGGALLHESARTALPTGRLIIHTAQAPVLPNHPAPRSWAVKAAPKS
jgi:hypothetical protein